MFAPCGQPEAVGGEGLQLLQEVRGRWLKADVFLRGRGRRLFRTAGLVRTGADNRMLEVNAERE